MKFINREIPVEGRDFCDMSGDYSKPLSDFSIVNIMLLRKYHPSLKDNVYEVRPAVFSFLHLLLTPMLNRNT
jgi:phytanoyl-CoA hydroxylase